MKCFINKAKNLRIMMFIGLALMFTGMGAAWAMGSGGTPLAFRLAGFVVGLGFALASVGAAWLIWKRIAGAQRAQDKELELGDERGQAINTKAQAITGFAAVFAVIAVDVVALVRGDLLYMGLCTAGCFVIACTGFVSRWVLGRRM